MTQTQAPILTGRNLVKHYGRVTALDHADFELYPGEILAIRVRREAQQRFSVFNSQPRLGNSNAARYDADVTLYGTMTRKISA